MTVINRHSTILAHYVMHLEDGSVAESTYHHEQPVKFVLGDGSLSESLEAALIGLKVGDKASVTLKPHEAFGLPEEANIMNLPRSHFQAELPLEEGLIMEFNQPNGMVLPGVIRRVMDDLVLVDFNHPLAGRTVTMTVEIMEIWG